MNRKILALNIALALLAVYAGYRLQQEWAAKRAREQAAVRARVKPAPFVHWKPEPVPPPVLPATYSSVAQKLLLDRSRNPDVFIPPPPPPPPPPVKVVPPLPGFHGEMNLDGPAALLSLGGGPQAIHPGEMIGPFKLIDINKTTIVFEWDGNLISKPVDELLVKAAPPAAVAANNGNPSSPAMAAAAPPPEQKALGPGESTQFGFKICQPNDSLPEGTVQDGYRKTSHRTPFGTSCTWEPVGGGTGK